MYLFTMHPNEAAQEKNLQNPVLRERAAFSKCFGASKLQISTSWFHCHNTTSSFSIKIKLHWNMQVSMRTNC